ncbi:hypothetical protein ANCCEY_00442 [Ancylostoma ceylanicum]|uniref:Protein kinase domain-containing protein n=1 Tax=Ancylostoma ceylanicum TaxID=53326 RepID=A0A0D6M8T9_9BILA|nr:hypothetical protein ANCCEY_00442 [Ancylostoma ceylanicum]
MDEIKMLSLTNHPHVIRLLATDENNGLILELAANGNVREYLRSQRLPIPTARLLAICADVCEGMRHLESLGVIHGHLTPSNILLDEGLRAKISSPRGPAHHAQLRYSAPESILKNSFSSNSDVWAFAVCCWEIAETSCTRIPFETFSNADLVTNAQRMLSGHDTAVVIEVLWAGILVARDWSLLILSSCGQQPRLPFDSKLSKIQLFTGRTVIHGIHSKRCPRRVRSVFRR